MTEWIDFIPTGYDRETSERIACMLENMEPDYE